MKMEAVVISPQGLECSDVRLEEIFKRVGASNFVSVQTNFQKIHKVSFLRFS